MPTSPERQAAPARSAASAPGGAMVASVVARTKLHQDGQGQQGQDPAMANILVM